MSKLCSLQGYVDGDWRTCFTGTEEQCEAEKEYQICLDHSMNFDFEYRIVEADN